MDQEHEERLKRIKGYAEEAAKRPLIHQGWVCDHPSVKRVWFIGYMVNQDKSLVGMKLEMEFNNGDRHSIDWKEVSGMEGNVEDNLAKKGDEYLRNLK